MVLLINSQIATTRLQDCNYRLPDCKTATAEEPSQPGRPHGGRRIKERLGKFIVFGTFKFFPRKTTNNSKQRMTHNKRSTTTTHNIQQPTTNKHQTKHKKQPKTTTTQPTHTNDTNNNNQTNKRTHKHTTKQPTHSNANVLGGLGGLGSRWFRRF